MRRYGALSVLIAACGVVLAAQTHYATYEQLTAGANAPAKSLAASTLQSAGAEQIDGCMVRVETASVRYRLDGVAPTATVGMPLSVGIDSVTLTPVQAQRFQVIQHSSASTTALVNVRCWK